MLKLRKTTDKNGNIKIVAADKPKLKNSVYITLNSDKWLLTQTTAVSSVNLFDEYKITPSTAEFVNNNGNSWDTELLKKIYKTFIGCHNYKNHVQDPKLSRGIVLDAVPRKVQLNNKEWNIYVDILVATSKTEYPDWCKAIENGTIKYGSVGLSCSTLRCSRCGHIADNPSEFCEHMRFQRGQYFIDPLTGDRLRQANMVWNAADKNGNRVCNFTEWSYLDNNPAYVGAALAYVISVPNNTNVTFECDARILKKQAFKIWQKDFEDVKTK